MEAVVILTVLVVLVRGLYLTFRGLEYCDDMEAAIKKDIAEIEQEILELEGEIRRIERRKR